MSESNKPRSVRIKRKIYNEIALIAQSTGFKTTNLLEIVLVQGLQSVRQNGVKIIEPESKKPEIEAEPIYKNAARKAKKGSKELSEYLMTLTSSEEQAIKYVISTLREDAKKADRIALMDGAPTLVEEGDKRCMMGVASLNRMYNALSKEEQRVLSIHYDGWLQDAKRSDDAMERYGYRPKERRFGAVAAEDMKLTNNTE